MHEHPQSTTPVPFFAALTDVHKILAVANGHAPRESLNLEDSNATP